jgi:hypothetical protein
MGRPVTVGASDKMAIKLSPKMRDAIASHAKGNDVSFSEAARQLIDLGLKAKAGAR